MEISIGRTLHGLTALEAGWGFADALAHAARQGAECVTVGVSFVEDNDSLARAASALGVRVIPAIYTASFGAEPDLSVHVAGLRSQLDRARCYEPPYVVCLGGRDEFDDARCRRWFDAACELQAASGVRIAHETHRGTPLYAPWSTTRWLNEFPELSLALDLSHWVIVTEQLLDDHRVDVEAAARRAIHVDARTGSAERPQVDPRASEFSVERSAFEACWDLAVESCARDDRDLNFNAEYLPAPYADADADDGVRTADVLNEWMMRHLRRARAERWTQE